MLVYHMEANMYNCLLCMIIQYGVMIIGVKTKGILRAKKRPIHSNSYVQKMAMQIYTVKKNRIKY